MHDRVADERELEDVGPIDPGVLGQPGDERLERRPYGPGHLARALGMEHRVGHAAHQVLAEPDLRVHHARRGEHLAVGQADQVAGERRRPDVHRHPEHVLVVARPDRGDRALLVDGDGHGVVASGQRRLESADDVQV